MLSTNGGLLIEDKTELIKYYEENGNMEYVIEEFKNRFVNYPGLFTLFSFREVMGLTLCPEPNYPVNKFINYKLSKAKKYYSPCIFDLEKLKSSYEKNYKRYKFLAGHCKHEHVNEGPIWNGDGYEEFDWTLSEDENECLTTQIFRFGIDLEDRIRRENELKNEWVI